MINRLQPGERVQLTERAAKGRNNGYHRSRIDWTNRKGVIRRANRSIAFVIWDGCRSAEPLPLAAVEPISG